MLDIGFIRENKKAVEDSIKQRGLKGDLKTLLALDEKRRQLIPEVEKLRSQLKLKGKPTASELVKVKKVKAALEKESAQLKKIESDFERLLGDIPNLLALGTPAGDETHNKVEKQSKPSKLNFKPKDHLEIAEANDWLDFEAGAKVAGNKFYYLKGAVVRLEMALMSWVMDRAEQAGFLPMETPHLINSRVAEGTGFAPRSDEEQEYKIAGEDLRLIATAEVPLTGYHADEVLGTTQLPKLYAGLSPSYRKEAGAYGKHSRGLFRVHQFNKLELYVLARPPESETWHQQLLAFEEAICSDLGIPYQVVRIAAGDLGAPAFKKYDIEYWSPAEQTYRELMSCSNCTDYQARNLNIRYRNKAGELEFVHTLNGTACASSRMLIAIMENCQTKEGKVEVPKILQTYMGGKKYL